MANFQEGEMDTNLSSSALGDHISSNSSIPESFPSSSSSIKDDSFSHIPQTHSLNPINFSMIDASPQRLTNVLSSPESTEDLNQSYKLDSCNSQNSKINSSYIEKSSISPMKQSARISFPYASPPAEESTFSTEELPSLKNESLTNQRPSHQPPVDLVSSHCPNNIYLSENHRPQNNQTHCKQLSLVLWKNLILRRRHWLLTLLEMFVSVALMAIIVYVRTATDSELLPHKIENVTTFYSVPENIQQHMFCTKSFGKNVFGKCRYDNFSSKRILFWGPRTNFTESIIKVVCKELNFRKKDLIEVTNKKEMDNMVQQAYVNYVAQKAKFFIGVYFNINNSTTNGPPRNLDYELRMQKYWFTDFIYPFFQIPGPQNFSVFSFTANYVSDGFLYMQSVIDRAYMKVASGNASILAKTMWEVQMYPYPPYVKDYGIGNFYISLFPSVIVLCLAFLSPTLIKSIVSDKETGVRELMRIKGIESRVIWVGWFLYSFFTVFFLSVIITAALKIELPSLQNHTIIVPPILPNSESTLIFTILLLYGISSICFCLAVSCFFSRPTLATTIGVLVWLISYHVPGAFVDMNYVDMSLTLKLLCCLDPNLAMKLAFKLSSMFEGRAIGLRWNNLWEAGNSRDQLTSGIILLMLMFDIVLYILITWYVDKISPGKFGVAKPWYFPIESVPWFKKLQRRGSQITNFIPNLKTDSTFIEDEPSGLKTGIKTRNLRKIFKNFKGQSKVAVEDVTLTCFEGQCTVLLGHNGAGKSTTMSIITGIHSSTRGYAEVNGWNIKTNLKQARSSLGLCPQHNTLFNDLTVEEHLLFFGQLKGLTQDEAMVEANDFLERLQLQDKRKAYGKMLSGGMKRKLCLSIALIGGSKTVILDEPSSGMDPESRRMMWDVIQKERGTRTVLITTHHMEEADALGDRIAIMSHGQIICCGSSLFLKNTFGDGYVLTVKGRSETNSKELESIVFKHFGAVPIEESEGFYFNFKLPNRTNKFSTLLDNLTAEKKRLKVDHIGLSMTTMDQVFFRVGELSAKLFDDKTKDIESPGTKYKALIDSAKTESVDQMNEKISQCTKKFTADASTSTSEDLLRKRLKGRNLAWQRAKSLFIKKFLYTKRKWILFITQAIIPVFITLISLAVDSTVLTTTKSEPSINLSLSMFTYTKSTVECNDCSLIGNQILTNYLALFNHPNEIEVTENTTEKLLQYAEPDITAYRENCITSLIVSRSTRNQTLTRMMYQSIPYHAAGIGMNLVNNAMLRTLVGKEYAITTTNWPLPPPPQSVKFNDNSSQLSSFLFGMVMPVALCFLTASFIVFPLEERKSNAKQIQLMTGTSPFLLGLTSYLFDMLTYIMTGLAVFVCFMAWDSKEVFTVDGAPSAMFTVILLYGVSAIPLSYVFSFLYNSPASGFAALSLLNITAGMIISLTTLILQKAGTEDLIKISYIVGNITSLVPAYPVSKAFMGILDASHMNKFCDVFEEDVIDILCRKIHSDNPESEYLACCPKYCNEIVPCFEYTSYFQWDYPGVAFPLLYFAIDFAVFFLLFWILEIRAISSFKLFFWYIYRRVLPPNLSVTNIGTDIDVVKERQESAKIIIENHVSEATVAILDLRKIYEPSQITAVSGVNFTVKGGECLGLLGVNGAGKTTTFKMITGDELPSAGEARIGDNFLAKNRRKFLKNIGYCPQFDAIIGELTGVEMLALLAGLRGLDSNTTKREVRKLVDLVDLSECADRLSSTYSGGNKRKLSTAMSLIGQPPVILLDEPTAGVDPMSRRRVWEAITKAIENGQSVILTSHSMDECEALCSKIIIMSKGLLRCAGSPVHLKAKYGVGRQLQIKLINSLPNNSVQECNSNLIAEAKYKQTLWKLKNYISIYFPESRLEDEHRGMLSYRIPSSFSWSHIFSVMEDLKLGKNLRKHHNIVEDKHNEPPETHEFYSLIEDYAALDPSLEQVFLSFARESQSTV